MVCPSGGHRAYPQPALCRAYLLQRQPVQAEARSRQSSDCALRPVSPGLLGSCLFF